MKGVYSWTEENTAYLDGDISLDASASVKITCYQRRAGETATGGGRGTRTRATGSCFGALGSQRGTVPLIAGDGLKQYPNPGSYYVAGSITFTRTVSATGRRTTPLFRTQVGAGPA